MSIEKTKDGWQAFCDLDCGNCWTFDSFKDALDFIKYEDWIIDKDKKSGEFINICPDCSADMEE